METRQTALPEFESFDMASQALEMHCGSIDCHGAQRRNFRLYGWYGIRLEPIAEAPATPSVVPSAAPAPAPVPSAPATLEQPEFVPGFSQTTEQERWLNYVSAVLLEPEATSVVRWEGRGAEKLLLVSKGRGREHHKGSVAMEPDGPVDRCVISWFVGAIDEAACTSAMELGKIPADFAGL